jgi:uncharacterized membrane protein
MSPDAQPADGSWRITDSDRAAAVEALGEHYATGRLDKAEYDERADRAWAARTDRDVTQLFTDLPAPRGNVVAPVVAASLARSGSGARRPVRGGWPMRHRGPFGPWLLLVIPLAIVLHAPWLIFVVLIATFVLRPARRWR